MAINVQKELKKLKKNSNGSNVQQSGQNTGRTDAEKQRVSANNAVLQKKNAEKVEDNGRTTAENQRAAANNVLLTGRTPEEKERKAESLGTPGALKRVEAYENTIDNAQKAAEKLKNVGESIEKTRNDINRKQYYGIKSTPEEINSFNERVQRFAKQADDYQNNIVPAAQKAMKEHAAYTSSPDYLKSYYQQRDKELVKEIDVAKENVAKRKDELEKEIADVNFKILNIEPENNTYPKEWGELQQKKGELERERDNLKNIVEDKKSERYYARVEYADLIKQAEYADKIKNYSVSGTDNYINKLKKEERVPAYGVDYISPDDKPQSNGSRKYSNALDDLIVGGTAAQKATFRAIYENEGKEAAYKYIDVIQQLLDDKRADKDYSAIRELPDVARVPVEMAVHTAAGVNDAATGLKGVVHAVTGNTDYIPDSSLQRTSSLLTSDENVGTWGRIWRSSFRSFGNMAPSIIIGNAAGTIAGGLGAAAGTAAKIGQAAQSGTFFMTTAGGAYRDAINSGKPYGEAVTYGIVNGASEVYLENLIGGIEGFGKSGAQRLLTGTSAGKAISARVGNVLSKASPNVRKAANILGYWVADASSEAVEEGLQEILDPFMQTIIFSEHDDAWDGFSAGQVFEAAAAGALTSFLMGAPRNYSMSKATSQVIKGNADADTISAVVTNEELRGSFENITGIRLDGDNEAAFKQITAFQAGVNGAENIDGRTKKGTNANVSRGKSFLESLPEDFKNMSVLEAAAAISDGIENYKAKALEKAKAEGKSLTDIIKEEGTPTPEKLIKDGKTAEELHNNEEIKRAATNVSDIQLTKADLKTDNGKKTDTLQKLSKALGVPIMLYHFEESGSDGFYDSSERTIYLNEGGVKPVLTALKHEIMHDMKLVDEQNYAKLKTFLTAAYKTLYGEDAYNSYIEGKRSEYLKNTGKECSDEKASDEFCADTCMDLLTNEKFVKEFVKSRYSTAQRLKRCIEKILNKIKSVFGAEADETSLDDALMQLAKINGNVDYAEQSRGYADVRNGSTETLPKMLDYDTLRKADSMLMSALYDYAEARKRVNEGFSEVRNNQDLSIDEKKAEYERRVNEKFDKESGEDSDNANEYSYETLTAKPDMKITLLDTDIPKNEDGKVDRKKVVEIALNAVRQAGNKKNTDVDLFVHVDDTGNDLKVNTDSIRHGLYRKAETNATAAINIAELAKNAVRVNELSSRSENSDGGYIYLSAGKDAQNNGYIVRIITDKGNTEIKDVETIYAIGAKKEAVAHNRQGYGENTPFAFTASSISISDLLNIVKNNYSDILSNSVLEHFGIERGKSAVSGDVVYSFANQPAVDGNNVSEVTHAEEQSEAQSDIQNESRSEAQQNTGVSYPLANLPAHTITEDTDTRTGETIYTLKFNEHLTPEQFNSARDEIKQNGGYYSRFKKGFIFKDDTLYKAYNEVYNKGTNTADNETADSAEIGVQSNDTGRNVKETAAGLLQGVPGSGEPSDTGAVRGVRESSGDGGGNGGVSGHTQRQTGESVLSEHDAGTARSVHGHSEHVIKQVAAFIKKYAAKRNYAKKNYAPTTEMGAREFIEQETKNGYTLIDEGGAIISYLKSDGKNLSDEVKNWVNRLGKLGITVNVSDGKLKRFIEGYCAEFDGFFHKKLNEIFLSTDILREDIDAKNHELFHYIFHNYPEIADRFVNTLFSNLSDKFDPLIQSELEWIFDGYADGDIYSENNLLKLTDEITAYFITYLNFGHKNSNLFNSIINDRATVEEAFNQMLDELERARSKTDGDADLSRTQENISKGENSDVQQGVLGRQDSDNDSVRESESVQKVEKDGDTGKENRNADGISGNENGVDVQDTQEISSSAGSESGGTVDDGVRKSDVRNGNDGTGHNGTDNVDVDGGADSTVTQENNLENAAANINAAEDTGVSENIEEQENEKSGAVTEENSDAARQKANESPSKEQINSEKQTSEQTKEQAQEQVKQKEQPEQAEELTEEQQNKEPENDSEQEKEQKPKNFSISKELAESIDSGRPSIKDNLEAIKVLHELEESGKKPTKAQLEILAKYKGWGGLAGAFAYDLSRLREVMTDEEIKSARSTVNDAYFTPTYVIDAIYSALKRLGCLGGNILEPSMGIGNFFGRIPKSLSEKSSLHGVEIDSISGRIASYLYSGADVKISGFQDAQFKDGAFDLIIGNVPFGDIKYDYKGTKYMIHDYFFMKSLDKLADGGVMALLTSSGTLDKYDTKLRNELSRRADLVAAYRLPATVFSKNAGANVVTDLIIFRKRAHGEVPNGESFINLSEFHGMPINEYFANHPENILGNPEVVRGQYGEKLSVGQTGDVKKMLDGAISKLPKNLLSDTKTVRVTDVNEFGNKAQSFRDSGDGVVYADFQTGEVKKITGKKAGIARDYMAVRDAYNNLIAARNASDTERKELRKTLNKVYDEFVKKNGSLTSNRVLLGADNDFIKTNGLEIYDTKTKKIIKSEVFFKDTFVKQAPKKAGNALDALGITISETGGVDLSRIASLLGTTEQNAAEQLSDRIILTPDGDYQLMEIYLSGNVRQKLKSVEGKPGYERNEKLLRSVLPVQKTAGNITPQFGASWIKPEYIRDFISQLFGLRFKPTVSYDSKSGTWYISGNIWGDNTLLTKKYGTSRIDGMKLAEKALNMRSVTVRDADGNVDVAETKAAADKIRDIKDAFEEWAFKDTERREALVNDYNDRFNSYANMDFSSLSEYLTFGGLSSTFKPRPYQKRAVARIVFNGNTLLAHGVGTGKTAEMIISAMERKRLGITKKNMFVVPNHKVSDFRNDILKMYPGAKVIYLEKGANAAQRTRFLSQVAANEWDIVIMPHSSFGMLDVSDGTKKQFIQNEIARLEETVTAARREQGKSIDARFIRDLEKQKKSLEANLKKITESPKDNGIVFEDLGVDSLFVDEAHNFKNLPFSSKLSRVSGVAINKPSNKTRASRAENMFMMTDHLNNNGGTVIFATATPITNSLSEMYNMMRFLAPKTLEDAGIGSFDAWASVFGDIVTSAEIDPTGTKIRMKERFSKFKNVPEMVSLFRQVADILKTADVVKDLPKAKYVNVTNESNPIQQEFLEILDGLIDEVRANGQKSQNNMLSITKMGQLAAIDLRFVKDLFGGKYTEEQLTLADNRLSKAAANIYEEYKKSDRNKGTQFVFCDEGVNGNPGKRYNFNAYADLINKLVAAGIPREEIAVAQDYEDKGELSGKVNSGEIRVLIGSTAVMGEGMNAQVKAVALHHLTVPYRPSDIEQREGRIIRYGNENKEVTIYRYIQERSYDSYQWQMLERKAGFINQALSGGNVEELEEMSDFVLSAREAKSIASGNPLFLEKVQVEDKISNLKSKQRRFISELEQNKHRLATLPETISRLKKNSESYKADADTVKRNTGKEFEITLGKKTYVDRADAAKALEQLMRKVPRNGKEVELGTFRGLKLSVSQSIEKGLVFYLDGKSRYTVSAGDSAAGNLTRITNSTEKIETMYNDAENAIDTYNGEIKTLESEVKRTFPNETELTELQERLSQIDSELGIGKNDDVDMSEVIAEDSADNDEDGDISYSFNGRNKKAAEDGDEKYDYTKSFEQQVDDYKKGLIPKYDSLIVSGTPKVLRDIGFNALPVTINRQHVDYALNGTKDADHSLGESMLKQLPKALESPIAVINSDTEPNRVVAILGFTVNGKNVIAPVQIDGFAKQNYILIDSNAIASIFGKGNVLKQLVTAINGETAGKKTLYYWDKKRALALLQWSGLQLSGTLPRAGSKEALSLLQRAGLQLSGGLPREGSIHSIRESGTAVNAKYENVTNSQQFKRWFGDWENSPQRASKAVDKNGKPKKLYHGTNSEINAFDLSKSGTNEGSTLGKGIYLTDVKSIAESFGKNVYELYASIKRPFDLGQRGTLSMFYNKLDKEFGISKLYGEQYSKNKLKGENSSVFDFMKSLADKNGVDVSDILQSLGFDGVHDGNEWVAYGENQVKSTDNIGLYGKDTDNIFYSFNGRNNSTDEENKYSYNRLTALDDMSVTRIVSSIPKKEDGKIDREAIISSGLNNAFKVGRRVNSDTAVVKNKYSGEEIAISKRGLKHSLDRRSAVALATLNIGEIVQNALRVNEMSPRNEHVAVSYPMVGYASDANGNKYAVLLVVNRNNDSYPTIDGVSVYETLYSHNAKKTESGVHSTRSYDDNSPLFPNSTISIAELMNVVKDQFPNVLSDDVLSHYGTSKTESNYDGILYSFNGRNSGETEQSGQSEQTDKGKYIPKGEKPFRDVNIPKEDAYGGKVSYGIRTYAEAESTPDERIATVLDDVKHGKYSHKVISDESALINAENLINTKGYAEAMQSILERVDYGFAIGKEDMALIELLLNNTQNYIDQSNALYNGVPATDLLVAAFINSASLAGQALQAVRAFKTLSPTAVLYGVESMANAENRHILAQTGRIVDEKNRQISGQRKGITTSEVKEARKKARENGEFLYSKKQELIVIDQTLKNNLLKARTADEVVAARDAIIENIASQIVTKFGEKVRAWRYMAMLTNPRTHVRNTIGNTMNMGMRGISNIVSALAEQAAQKAGLISQADRKHGIIGFDAAKKAEYRKIFEYAGDYFDANSAELKGKSRYNAAMSDIEQARKIFETGWLERLRRFNSDKLEKEDIFFMRREFASQFAHAAVARGYTLSDISNGSISKNVIKDLMLYAAREAQRTTFREANSFANALNKVSNSSTGAGILIDAIIPFKSTPMNILREGVRYSPVSIVSGIKQIFEDYSIKNASNGAIEHIDGVGIIQKFSEGMTGTALMALGAMLYQFGMLTAGDDDKDEYNLRKAKGEQSYSLRFGNVYFDISWAAPVCMPLLAGAQAAKIFEGWDSDKGPLDKALAFGNSLLGIATPILETSMMQGVLDVIKSMRYSEDGEMIGDAVTTAMSSLILQYCPSVLAAMGRVFDDIEYRTDLPDSTNGTAEYERFLRKVANKIPFVRRLNLPGTDIMGKYEQKKNIGDYALSLAQNTFIPGYISTLTGNGAAEHLCDVLEQSGDAEFLPNYVKDFTVDGVKHKMTAQELHDFNVQRGLIYDSVIPVLEKSDWYSGLDAGIKAKVLRELRDVSNEICKYKINDGYKIGKAAYAVMKKEDNPEYFAKYLRSMSKSFIIKAKNGADVDQADDEELAS